MRGSTGRIISGILIAAAGIYLGVRLAMYSEADDAPGGVLMAAVLIVGAIALGSWIAFRRTHKPSAPHLP